MLIEETSVPDAALPVEEFKAHLRLGSGFTPENTQDEVLLSFLRAALSAIEGRTGKALFERSFRWDVTAWRSGDAQALPIAPITALTSLEIVARDGTRTVVDTDAYWLERDPACPRLRSTGFALPAIPHAGKADIVFQAGYGDQWAMLPPDLQQAVMLLAAHYYEYRDETSLSEGCLPFGVLSLIERYKAIRLYGGGGR